MSTLSTSRRKIMINIMFAGNYKVFDGMLIASLSILKYCKEPITAYILTMDLTENNPEFKPISSYNVARLDALYKEVNKDSCVKVIDVKEVFLARLKDSPNNENFYTPYTLLRLLAEDIKEIPDKVLYMDTDVVANGNIAELYNIDIEKYELAGVRDYYGKFFFYPRYLNAGVLLFNMKKIRETHMLTKAVDLLRRKKVFLSDQTAINKYTKKKLILNHRFNEQKKLRDNTVIRHFSMTLKFFPKFKKQNIKPWHIDKVHEILKIYEFDDILNKYQEIMKNNEFEGFAKKQVVKGKGAKKMPEGKKTTTKAKTSKGNTKDKLGGEKK